MTWIFRVLSVVFLQNEIFINTCMKDQNANLVLTWWPLK